MSYDVKCHALALAFLGDCETKNTHTGVDSKNAYADELSQRIQDTIEDFIAERELRNRSALYREPSGRGDRGTSA